MTILGTIYVLAGITFATAAITSCYNDRPRKSAGPLVFLFIVVGIAWPVFLGVRLSRYI